MFALEQKQNSLTILGELKFKIIAWIQVAKMQWKLTQSSAKTFLVATEIIKRSCVHIKYYLVYRIDDLHPTV